MAFTETEEALLRELLGEKPELDGLADNYATILSKLASTKVTLSDLAAATLAAGSDLLLVRQDGADKSLPVSVLINLLQSFGNADIYGTWAALDAVTGTAGDVAIVISDAGTHTDPVTAAVGVLNEGVYIWSTDWERIADLQSKRAEDAADAAAISEANALAAAAATSAAVASAVQNGGPGLVMDANGGYAGFRVSANMTIAYSAYSENTDGTKGTTWFSLDTKTGRFNFGVPVSAPSAQLAEATVQTTRTPSDTAPVAFDGAAIFAPPKGTRYAWGVAGVLWYDGIAGVLRAPAATPSDETKPTTALVLRGGDLGVAKPAYPPHARSLGYYPYIAQGAAMRSKGLRTHQLIPALGKSRDWIYCVFDAAANTLGAAYNIPAGLGPETANSYCVVMRRKASDVGGAWQEVAQILPSNAAARCAIPMVVYDGDRVLILFSFSSLGSTIHTWALGCYGVLIENPECPDGGKLIFGKPRMMGYGIPGGPVTANGEIYSVFDVWRWADQSTYSQYGSIVPVTLGSRLTRIVTRGPGAPYAEPLSYITGLPSGVDNSSAYYETALAMTNGGGWLVHQRASDGIYETSTDADLGAWPVPVSASSKTNMLNSSRSGLARTPMGNLAFFGNMGSGNRWNMGLRISEDEGATFSHEKIVDARNDYNVTYPNGVAWVDPTTGRSKIAFAYDYGRGAGASYPADIMYFEAFEDELLAGTSAATRQTINSLAYTGA